MDTKAPEVYTPASRALGPRRGSEGSGMRKSRDEGLSWTDQRDGMVRRSVGNVDTLATLAGDPHQNASKPGIPQTRLIGRVETSRPTIQLCIVYIIPDPWIMINTIRQTPFQLFLQTMPSPVPHRPKNPPLPKNPHFRVISPSSPPPPSPSS
jgi:hypothetical protein